MGKRIPWSRAEKIRVENLLNDGYSYSAAAKIINYEFHDDDEIRKYHGVRGQARFNHINVNPDRYAKVKVTKNQVPEFTRQEIPAELQPVEDLIAERIRKYEIKSAHKSIDCVDVKINLDGPIGVAHFGDPHVDDDGTDLSHLFHCVDIIKNTPGMLAGNVGDVQNNWIGRLQRLYGEQSTSAQESWQITSHFVKMVPWLYLIAGNHDCWSGAGDPLEWICGQGQYTKHGSRMQLKFPNKRTVTINARHQWSGNSQWNTAHAIAKAAQMGWDDHVLVGGHTHVSGYQVIRNPKSSRISHCLQVASFKIHDRYAEEKGLQDKNIFNCPVTIIDPDASSEKNLVHVIFDPEEAADYLTWKRQKAGCD